MVNPYDSDVKLRERTLGSETSQYQEEKRKIIYSRSSGERNGKSPNLLCLHGGGCRAVTPVFGQGESYKMCS